MMHVLRAPVGYTAVGGVLGVLASASGAVVLVALVLGHPVGLLLLVGLAARGLWRAVRRHRAGGLACCFAPGVGVAQWPLTA